MELDRKSFIYAKDLLGKINNRECDVFVFGASALAKEVSKMLNYHEINIKKYLDNDEKKWGNIFNDIEVVSPNEVLKSENPIVIIGSCYIDSIYKQLVSIGIKEIFIILDIIAYSHDKVIEDQKTLKKYFNEDEIRKTNKILIKCWDGLGDSIIKLGIYKFLSEMENGRQKFHIITQKKSNYELLSLFFDNVRLVNDKKFLSDRDYRLEVLEDINKEYFQYDMCFCITIPGNSYELFNSYNINTKAHYINKNMNFREYHLNTQIELLKEICDVPEEYNFSPKGLLDEKIKNVIVPYKLPQQYICIGMGSDSGANWYSEEKLSIAVNHFLEKGYNIVFVGYGEKDEKYYENLISRINIKYRDNIANLCSQLSIFETIKVVQLSSIYFGLDSGLYHCAYVLDKKAVVLMGGHWPEKYKHNDKNIIYLNNHVECEYCYPTCIYKKDSIDYAKCVSMIESEKIIQAIEYNLK